MCGRFEVKEANKKIKKRFGLKLAPPSVRGPEMKPTDRILTIDGESGHARGRLLGWGLKVDWDAKPLINARAESLQDKPTFRPLLNRRCLVPASAYFEWQRPQGGPKQKMRIHPGGQDLFAMAGLVGADGDTVTIITTTPSTDIADIHDRMPVILKPEDESLWIDPSLSFDALADKLQAYSAPMAFENADKSPALL
ncbi:SOS response-associated peptidase [Magnetovibrio sp. PR-2]|uniref:SOS response-associated peptidase n=1 Tax=Magnetovibrio sp. PR-2 TaxID=3120356 RepID=UPI002FCDFAC3